MSSRRNFLKDLSLLGLVAMRSDKANLFSQIPDSYAKIRVAIVGGGLAGLRAAYLLSKHDRFDVKLFEGSKRLGGRIYTRKYPDGSFLDLGGQWVGPALYLQTRPSVLHNYIKMREGRML